MKTIPIVLSVFLFASQQVFALYDNFSGNQLNTTNWIANVPYSDSAVIVNNGLDFQNGGGIITADAQGAFNDITGEFNYAGSSYDQFGVLLRSNGALRFGSYGTFSDGVYVEFNLRSGDQGTFNNNIKIDVPNQQFTATYPMDVGSSFNFRIVDTGTEVSVFIGDLTNPILTATTSFAPGDLIAFQNREGAGNGSYISAGSDTHIDFLSIESVPEPATWLGSSLVATLLVACSLWRKIVFKMFS